MLINEEMQAALRERGIYAKEACDKCRRILGPVRFTFQDSLGAYCSRECRGGRYIVSNYSGLVPEQKAAA